MSEKSINNGDLMAYELFTRIHGLNNINSNDGLKDDVITEITDDEYGVGLAEQLSDEEMKKLLKEMNKGKNTKKKRATKKNKRETSKHTFTGLKPIKCAELDSWEHVELADSAVINVSYGNYSDGINNMEGRMAKRSVRYEIKLVKQGIVASSIYEEIYGRGKGNPDIAKQGINRYYKIEAIDVMPLQYKVIGYVEVMKDSENKGEVRKRILLKNKLLREYAANPKNVRKSVERALKNLVK